MLYHVEYSMKILSLISPKIISRLLVALVLEFGPVFVFLISFEYLHVYKATVILMIATIISTVATFSIQKRLPYMALYVALLTSIFGYITLSLHEPRFIQMRDTLYDATCALTLIFGLMINVSFLKLAFHKLAPMSDRGWKKLTKFWIGFFISLSLANEYVRRTMTLTQWFDFKTIVVVITVIFGFTALYLSYESEEEVKNNNK